MKIENGIDPQSVIFSDEKNNEMFSLKKIHIMFSLTPQKNRQNTHYWSETNMHLYKLSYKQGQKKVMCRVGER